MRFLLSTGLLSVASASVQFALQPALQPAIEICEEDGAAVLRRGSRYAPGGVEVLQQANSEIIFTASQVFSDDDAWMSVVFEEEGGMACHTNAQALAYGHKVSYKAKCDETGVATIDVYIQNSGWNNVDDLALTLPETCPVGSSPRTEQGELFTYHLACGLCDGCTPPPVVPVEVTPPDGFCEGGGVYVRADEDEKAYKAGAVTILEQAETTVTFLLNQIITTDPSLVHVVFDNADDDEEGVTCATNPVPLPYEHMRSFRANCDVETGIATVDVYVHNGAWTDGYYNQVNPSYSDREGECPNWSYSFQSDVSSGVALITYELSCGVCADCYSIKPGCEFEMNPEQMGSTYCPDDRGVTGAHVIGVPQLSDDINLVYDIEETDGATIKFKVHNPFPESKMFVQYEKLINAGGGGGKADECYGQDWLVCETETPHLEAACMHADDNPVTLVQVYFASVAETSPFEGGATVYDCCEDVPEGPTVAQYTFMIRCSCPTNRRNLLRGESKIISNEF